MIQNLFGGFTWSNGKRKFYVGRIWQMNSAYCWKRYQWHWRGGEFGKNPNKLQRFLAYFDFRRS